MSFDNYATYITQKFRLSTAIAVIKTKPKNLTTEQYINELKDKINVKMDDDLDISICSDDFNLDDNAMITDDLMNISDTILTDYNFENDLFQDVCNDKSMAELSQQSIPNFSENLTQTTHYETQANPNPITQANINPIIEQEDNDATYCDTVDIENNIPINIIKDSTIDSQKTILYTVYGYTQNTHYSPSQTNIIIPKGHIYGNNNNKGIKANNNMSDNNTDVINDIPSRRDVNNDNSFNEIPNMNEKNDSEGISTVHASGNTQFFTIPNESNKNVINDNEKTFTKDASESNEILDIYPKNPDNRQTFNNNINNSKYYINESQNINERDVINDNDRISKPIISLNSVNVKDTNSKTEQSQNSQDIPFFSQDFDENCYENIINLSINTNNSMNIDRIEFCHHYTDKVNTKAIRNKASNELNDTHHIENNDIIITNKQVTESVPKAITLTIESSQNIDIFSQNDEINENNDKVVNERELNGEIHDNSQIIRLVEDSQEVIPFKILEEFNKVKSFLSRNERRMSVDGYSTDSGYRSDSQSRANKSALQLSGNWLNQSGHCLFNYIAGCHLVVTTREITNEIAQVLGQLIDKLHEEEQYPSFLEALLEANNVLLRQLCEGENNTENVLLNRDENIQRLILLNHSVNIQKFSIEKITVILTDYHIKLNDSENVFEFTNIDEIENLYYLFHILEVLLKKYNKKKDLLSQTSTQPSQDEIFKKSSITDLWKRKWNPNYQDGGTEGGCEKTCVLQVCSEILNKIIVDCFNSCSLVSYAALKCFNLTQS